jgi:hypothetical protein
MSAREEPLTSLISFHRNKTKEKVRNIPFARHCLDLIGYCELCEGKILPLDFGAVKGGFAYWWGK